MIFRISSRFSHSPVSGGGSGNTRSGEITGSSPVTGIIPPKIPDGVTGGDSNGYAMSPGYSGGTAAATIKMTSDIYETGKGTGFRPGRR